MLPITSILLSFTNFIIIILRLEPKQNDGIQDQPMNFLRFMMNFSTWPFRWTTALPAVLQSTLGPPTSFLTLETYLGLLGNIIHGCSLPSWGDCEALYFCTWKTLVLNKNFCDLIFKNMQCIFVNINSMLIAP